ncbi:MAG: hypothetical protein QM500_15010 [Methylococcales bacterium]
MKKLNLNEAVKRVLIVFKKIKETFEKAEKLKDTQPEVYDADNDRYITNPSIDRLYKQADQEVGCEAKYWGIDTETIISMVNDLDYDVDKIKTHLNDILKGHHSVIIAKE